MGSSLRRHIFGFSDCCCNSGRWKSTEVPPREGGLPYGSGCLSGMVKKTMEVSPNGTE